MLTILKNMVTYVRNLINGDEYISDRTKITYVLTYTSVIHVLCAVFFAYYGLLLLAIYNIGAFFVHQFLIGMAKKKIFLPAMTLSCVEIMVFSVLTTLCIGNFLNFNLYCFCIIPAIYYVTSTVKDFKKNSGFAFGFSVLALITYITTLLLDYYAEPWFYINLTHSILSLLVESINGIMVIGMMVIFSLLFTWEVKNDTDTLEKRNQKLLDFANKDPLTRLPNRRSMMQVLNVSMHQVQIGASAFSIILGDIDNFKKINDNYGHDMGDKVLVSVANQITSQLRDGDAVCRWGGEEILILVRGDLDTAISIAERIRGAIQETDVTHNNSTVRVTMTFGVAEAEKGYRIEQLIQQADNRLYYGKEHGKNQTVSA